MSKNELARDRPDAAAAVRALSQEKRAIKPLEFRRRRDWTAYNVCAGGLIFLGLLGWLLMWMAGAAHWFVPVIVAAFGFGGIVMFVVKALIRFVNQEW